VLSRVVLSSDLACARREKAIRLDDLDQRALYIDGHNVIITTESLLGLKPVYLCDDGFLRDAEGVFRHHRLSDLTYLAVSEILSLVAGANSSNVTFLLDEQMSRSGELAMHIRGAMEDRSVFGTAATARDVDFLLKASPGPVATADGSIIDSSSEVVDIPAELARRMSIQPLVL